MVYEWLPLDAKTLLDVGCARGDATAVFALLAPRAIGIEVNKRYVAKARGSYPHLQFEHCAIENTPFQAEFFDVVVMSDTLEHVRDEVASMDEIYRILKPDGICIITVPHKGMFAFLDPANYKFIARRYVPWLYAWFYDKKLAQNPEYAQIIEEGRHRHYSRADITALLQQSKFSGQFSIEHIARTGLIAHAINANARALLRPFVGQRVARALLRPLDFISALEYRIPFGTLAYNIALRIRKHA